MSQEMRTFKDKNGKTIKAGDTLIHKVRVKVRERPGAKRVAVRGMSGEEVIVPDEGKVTGFESLWIEYIVKWDGACLVAERAGCSDFNLLFGYEVVGDNGRGPSIGAASHYFNNAFNSQAFEVKT